MRYRLTDRSIAALKPRAKRYEVWDEIVPGLGVRVDAARKSFVVVKRFPGAKHPTRRTIGRYGVISLADARDAGRKMIGLIANGIDPAEELRRARQTVDDNRACMFDAVAEDYISKHLRDKRRGKASAREILSIAGNGVSTEVWRAKAIELGISKGKTTSAQNQAFHPTRNSLIKAGRVSENNEIT